MDWYTFVTVTLINAGVIAWTIQQCAPGTLFKDPDNQILCNLFGIVVISGWAVGQGFRNDSFLIKEVAVVIFVCSLISFGVNLLRTREKRREKRLQLDALASNNIATNVLEMSFYRQSRTTSKH